MAWGFKSPPRHQQAGYCKPAETIADKPFKRFSGFSLNLKNRPKEANLALVWSRFGHGWFQLATFPPSLVLGVSHA